MEDKSIGSFSHFRFRVGDRSRKDVESCVEKRAEDALGDGLQGGAKGLSP